MSMLDLFRRHSSLSFSFTPVDRAASFTILPSRTHSRSDGCDDNDRWLESDAQRLKWCATTASVARTTDKRGWGIVPVLNELERRSSTNTLLLRRSPSAQQLLCLNCRRLYFPSDSHCTPQSSPRASPSPRGSDRKPTTGVPLGEQFCSLDCKSSYACQASTQELVDLQLHGGSATSSDGDDGA